MDRLEKLRVFVAIAEHGAMSAVARAENLAPSTVSLVLKQLEDELHTRLIIRSTRRMSLTPDGERFLVDCRRLISVYREIMEPASDSVRLQGDMRVTATNDFGRARLAPLVDAFMREHPAVKVSIMLTDQVLDLVGEGYDLGIRTGPLSDSQLLSRLLVRGKRQICASPEYWRRAGRPTNPRDLLRHNCLVLARPGAPQSTWRFREGKRDVSVRVSGDRAINDGGALRDWAVAGAGVILKASFDIEEDLAAGRLETVLDEFSADDLNLYAVHAAGARPPRRVSAFIAFLVKGLLRPSSGETDHGLARRGPTAV